MICNIDIWGKRGRRTTAESTPLSRPTVLFQAEPEEDLPIKAARSSSSRALFAAESEEAEDSPTPKGKGCTSTEKTQFSFGWSKLHQSAKARFNKNVAAIPKPPKKKRPYDNQKRAARAAYSRSSGVFKQNGKSSTRISGVISRDECLCSFVLILNMFSCWCRLRQYLVLFFDYIPQNKPRHTPPVPRCSKDVLHPVQASRPTEVHWWILGVRQVWPRQPCSWSESHTFCKPNLLGL